MNAGQFITLLEKSHYPFRNYPQKPCSTLLFPGCSFPSQFPKSMDRLAELCLEHGVGVAYDCCGKPMAELNREKDASRILKGISRRLSRLGVKEIVCLCPNCQEFFGERLDLPVLSVYTLLARWGYVYQGESLSGVIFRPCPDRKEGRILTEISQLVSIESLRPIEKVACCGLGGKVAALGPAVAAKMCAQVKEQGAGEVIYTYCASCSGQFQRHNCGEVRHLLSPMLGVDEEPDVAHALLNRAKRKFQG